MAIPEGTPFTASELTPLGTRTAVDQAVSRLVKQGVLTRVTRGVYVRPRISPVVGQVPPSAEAVVSTIAKSGGHAIGPHGAEAARRLGLSNQVPMVPTFLTTGRSRELSLGALTVRMRHVAPSRLALAGRPAGVALTALTYLGPEEVSDEVISQVIERLPDPESELLARSRQVPKWLRSQVRRAISQRQALVA
jgi:hypothetical protein